MAKRLETEVKVGIFVTVGTLLTMASILILGGTESILTRKVHFNAHFRDIEGLITGAKVVLGGVQVGTVDSIDLDNERRDIRIDFSVSRQSADWVRRDANVQILTQGVLGDKYLSIRGGSSNQPPMPPGSEIPNAPSKNLAEFITSGDHLMHTLNNLVSNVEHVVKSFEHDGRSETFFAKITETSKNLASLTERLDRQLGEMKISNALKKLDSILTKIDNGTGTLGALVNDPGLYDDAKSLLGGANRNRVVRNLVRQTVKEGDKKEAEAAAKDQPQKKK
jgi:phospholipid/cholesterol/gamma-HCH transport system substrate-binding protein